MDEDILFQRGMYVCVCGVYINRERQKEKDGSRFSLDHGEEGSPKPRVKTAPMTAMQGTQAISAALVAL